MAMAAGRLARGALVSNFKRGIILDAAREVFEAEGLDGASLRAIAAKAGYTPAALYFHFDSREAIYAELLMNSLQSLRARVESALRANARPAANLRAAAMAFFSFYAENPRDLDLGFYLFRGGMRPKGLGEARDKALNGELALALAPISASARGLGASKREADLLTLDLFAHASGLLLLLHTGRIRMFSASAPDLMARYIDERIKFLERT